MPTIFATAASRALKYLTDYREVRRSIGLRWWVEIIIIGACYLVYSMIRNYLGSDNVTWKVAFDNAKTIIEIERYLGLYQELRLQEWFIDWELFIRFWNIFYGLLHFAVTGFVLFWLYVRFPDHFARWRTIGLITTGLALVGFAIFPLMPPRLLGAGLDAYGADMHDLYPFVDTVKEFGGLWQYGSGALRSVSNQYAAMPSLHFAWACWCTIAIYSRLSRVTTKTLAVLYPIATLFAILVTANHFWLDAVGGALVLGVGYVLGTYFIYAGPSLRENLRLSRKASADEPAAETTAGLAAETTAGPAAYAVGKAVADAAAGRTPASLAKLK